MLLTIIVLALAGCYIEARLVNSWPPLGRLLERHRDIALIFSLGLSMVLGMVFGAGGVLIFAGGIVSTVLIVPWYWLRRTGNLERLSVFTRSTHHQVQEELALRRDTITRRARQVVAIIKLCCMVLLLPARLVGWMLDTIESVHSIVKVGNTRSPWRGVRVRVRRHG